MKLSRRTFMQSGAASFGVGALSSLHFLLLPTGPSVGNPLKRLSVLI